MYCYLHDYRSEQQWISYDLRSWLRSICNSSSYFNWKLFNISNHKNIRRYRSYFFFIGVVWWHYWANKGNINEFRNDWCLWVNTKYSFHFIIWPCESLTRLRELWKCYNFFSSSNFRKVSSWTSRNWNWMPLGCWLPIYINCLWLGWLWVGLCS